MINKFFEVGELYTPKSPKGIYLVKFANEPKAVVGFPGGDMSNAFGFSKVKSVLIPEDGILLCLGENLVLKEQVTYIKDLYVGDVTFLYENMVLIKNFNYNNPKDLFIKMNG